MRNNESGRSMVEMLGVLAVIGVLTVGAIIGYRYSVDRIMANRVVTGVRERAVIAGQQRVLGQPLNLKEFYPDTDTDLIYGRFEVEADNAYENLAYGFTADMGVQAITVYDLPQRVCEYVRETDFPDPVLRLVNGREMDSSEVECLPDGPRGADTGLTNAQGFLDGEYHNVVTFVFDEPLASPCESDSECLPCGRCNDEGYCEANEALDGNLCSHIGCCRAGLCDPNGCACPPDDPRPETGCWMERTTEADPPCPGHRTYTPCACPEGWSTTEEPCAGTVNTQTISGYNGVSLTCYQCQECPKGNTCPVGQCCTETTIPADDSTGCPAYKTYTPTTCQCSAGFSKTPCGDGQMTKETETLKDGTVCYQCQDCPKGSECPVGQCCTETTIPADDSTGCPAYKTYTPTTCQCSAGFSKTPCGDGQMTKETETLKDGTVCYQCQDCPKSNDCPPGTCCKEETVPADDSTGCPAYTKYTPTDCECSTGFSKTPCGDGQIEKDTETLPDETKCYQCQCPEGNTCPNGQCCDTTEHAATNSCPAYTTYEITECACPRGFTTIPCGNGSKEIRRTTVGNLVCYSCIQVSTTCDHPGCCCPERYYCPGGINGTRYTKGCDKDWEGEGSLVAQLECPAGFHCPLGSNEPTPCPNGFDPQSRLASTASECCAFGYDGTKCVNNCRKGAAPNALHQCVSCGRGTYSDNGTVCKNCTGKTDEQHTQCYTTCPIGTYDDGEKICKSCPAGSYCPGDGKKYSCAVGMYQDKSGQEKCMVCPEGYLCKDGSMTECAAGTYQDQTGQSECKSCPDGTYQDRTGQKECKVCPEGYLCKNGSKTKCARRTYQDQTGQSECKSCPDGTYQDQTGQKECKTCQKGAFCKNGSMTQCAPGTYQNEPGQTACKPCPVDTYSNTTGNMTCIKCRAGYSTNNRTGQTYCERNTLI